MQTQQAPALSRESFDRSRAESDKATFHPWDDDPNNARSNAGDLTRSHIGQLVHVVSSGRNYIGILRHFTHTMTDVHVFITSSDNAVIVCSLRLDPTHQITFTGATK